MHVVILAAGQGTRLGGYQPKPLTPLYDGRSIIELQLAAISKHLDLEDVTLVVGYKKELIMEAFPELSYVYNPAFGEENTAKSLLRALHKIHDDDCLWLNGDVVFKPAFLSALLASPQSAMLVNQGVVAEEEVKYRTDGAGRMTEVSKEVVEGEGEAIGINLIRSADLDGFRHSLERCAPMDYFEKGLELSLSEGLDLRAVVVPRDSAVEVDFPEDLERANVLLHRWKKANPDMQR
ncbi:MAG: phosphocholine cytidylyltransferase family protein [Chlamydiia bacterium]|nr:phosphocholine cytidylyltransferase family protein [Chlamydiia bacterium]